MGKTSICDCGPLVEAWRVCARRLLATLDAIVIDELHAFLHGPRGLHLAALLRRIDALGARARRIGLSATIGDPRTAAAWLCPAAPEAVTLIEVEGGQPELRLQVRGHAERGGLVGTDAIEADGRRIDGEADALSAIADHVWRNLRDSNNLLFAGSRRNVEEMADRLRRRSDEAGVPNAFLPHHGNLSRELREEVEARLKDGTVPTTAVATTTLELGIDIGSVASVAQLGAPRSLAGLRQRLGRSGRRTDTPAVLRVYIREPAVPADPLDRLRLPTVRATAAVRLLLARFVEPPERHDPALLSVAVQQILSLIVEHGGIASVALHRALFASPPLALAPADLAALLRGMADAEAALIEQAPDGLLMLGRKGERITERRDFYANFETDEEWTLVAGGRTLGTIPLANAVAIGGLIGFAGRRWRITAVDDRARVVQVTAHPAGRLPMFENGSAEPIHDRLAAEMRAVLEDDDAPRWLDAAAMAFLAEGRSAWRALGAPGVGMIEAGRTTHLLTWRGTAFNGLAAVAFVAAGLHAEAHDIGVAIEGVTPGELVARIPDLLERLDLRRLSEVVEGLRREKYDGFVPERLLRSAWADRHIHLVADLGGMLRQLAPFV